MQTNRSAPETLALTLPARTLSATEISKKPFGPKLLCKSKALVMNEKE
jgi:hypothetical protein